MIYSPGMRRLVPEARAEGVPLTCHRSNPADVVTRWGLQVNSSPFEQGWMMKVKVTDKDGMDSLLDTAAYEKKCEEKAH